MVKSIEEIEEEVKRRLSESGGSSEKLFSQQFTTFKQEEKEETKLRSFFEKYAAFSSKFLSFIKVKDESEPDMYNAIVICDMKIKPKDVIAASIFTIILGIITALPLIVIGWIDYAFFTIVTGIFIAYIVYTYPKYAAQITKIRAQQESLLAILYITIYMRINPVLENAMAFASEHLNGPLGKDIKTILWLLEGEKIASIQEGLNLYQDLWIKRNKDFVKSFLILLGVMQQSDREHQSAILDKALNTILQDTYEKMKHFSHELKMPVVILYTFGLMLPLIGLIAFPMISVFMSQSIKISYLFFGYIIVLPALIYFLSSRIISKRPGAFSAPDVSKNPELPPPGKYRLKIKDKEYLIPILPTSIFTAIIIMTPGILHLITKTIPAFHEALKLPPDSTPPAALVAEYDIIPVFITLTVPVGLAVGVFLYFYLRSAQKVKLRNQIIEIEEDLGPAIYQISNQFTENIPIETAIKKFIDNYNLLNLKKRQIYHLFLHIVKQMSNVGITFEQAIFDQRFGVLKYYPSVLLKEVMWIFTESARRGSKTVYNTLNKISVYLENTKKIKELIYDLLTDTVSSIRMQAQFLSPFIAGIVGSLTTIIVKALYEMLKNLEDVMKGFTSGLVGDTKFFTDFIHFTKITPPTLFQVLVGIYTVEVVVLLSILANGVENGFDEVSRDNHIAKNIIVAIIVYIFVTIIGTVALNNLIQKGSALATV